MAGSLNHIIKHDGSFTMDYIENMRDAHEALSECFQIIRWLSMGEMTHVSKACRALHYPDPYEYGRREPMKATREPREPESLVDLLVRFYDNELDHGEFRKRLKEMKRNGS